MAISTTEDPLADADPPSPAPPRRPSRLRAQLVVLAVGVVVAGFGAVAWSRWVADDDNAPDVVLAAPGEYQYNPDATNPNVSGEPFPTGGLVASDGSATAFTSDGRPMVVNFWATWCTPCERELAYFGAVDDAYPDEQVRFVGINTLSTDSMEELTRFAAERGGTYEQFLDSSGEITANMRVVNLPLTVFVDADGEIVNQTMALSEQELRDAVAELVGPPAAAG